MYVTEFCLGRPKSLSRGLQVPISKCLLPSTVAPLVDFVTKLRLGVIKGLYTGLTSHGPRNGSQGAAQPCELESVASLRICWMGIRVQQSCWSRPERPR